MNNPFLQEAREFAPWLNEIFFQLHRQPELGCQEFKTQALILRELEAMGIEAATIADTGVLGIIRGERPGKTVAFRADMDALPIQEETGLPYASQIPGVMHACGHDSHVTMLLGAAKLLNAHKDKLQGNVKLFFQPAEESSGGAQRMIAAGCMENPHVDGVFFGHSSSKPMGTIEVRAGANSAASNTFTVTFRGKGSHGAAPHKGTDVIVAACQAVTALQTICSRRTNPTDAVVVTIGSFHAGTSSNILPESAVLTGIIRTLSPEVRARAKEDFRQILSGVAAAMNVEVEIDLQDGYAATINDEAMTQIVRASAAKVLGKENVLEKPLPTMGTEDFSYFCQAAPGCNYHIGTGNPEKGPIYPGHTPKFAVDPEALLYGTAIYAQIAEDFLNQN